MANCTGRLTAAGRAKLASMLMSTDQNPTIWVAWGSGTDDIADTDTGLGFEVSRKRGTVTRTSAKVFTVTASFDVSSEGTFSEMGLFDAASGGTMLYRGGYSTDSPTGVYDVESLDIVNGDVLSLTIPITLKGTNASITTVGLTKAASFLSATTT